MQRDYAEVAEASLRKVLRESRDHSSLVIFIPAKLKDFARSALCRELIGAIHEYLLQVLGIRKKYALLEKIVQERGKGTVSVLSNEMARVNDKLRVVNRNYAKVLLQYSDAKNPGRDQAFFEALLYLLSKMVKQLFPREDYNTANDQLNRIFRSNKFNLVKRRQEQDQLLAKFPALKEREMDRPEGISSLIARVEERSKAMRQLDRASRLRSYSVIDPDSRSPVMGSLLPSSKESMRQGKWGSRVDKPPSVPANTLQHISALVFKEEGQN